MMWPRQLRQVQIEWDADECRWVVSDHRGIFHKRFRRLIDAEMWACRGECPDYVEDAS